VNYVLFLVLNTLFSRWGLWDGQVQEKVPYCKPSSGKTMFDLVFRGFGKFNIFNRIVELQGGKIDIDGHDISKIGLDVLRGRLALVPQDSTLFLGTLRENLYVSLLPHFLTQLNRILGSDPQRLRTDAELISVLQRAWLLPKDGSSDPAVEAKFSLDSTVGDEGLLSLSRLPT
jgi:ABC-type multidrug transport system fused ATPase/permease subunit